MKKLHFYILIVLIFSCIRLNAQEDKKFKIHTIAFYNLENLFDSINDPLKNDEASPIMEMNTDRRKVYEDKLKNMARVLADIGTDLNANAPSIIGVCEIENKQVLMDLVNHPFLIYKDYGIVHYDSPDRRGIDVALLYQKKLFKPINTSSHELKIFDDNSKKRIYTRDQLLVSGYLEEEMIHIIVNHWPSRRGGEARSRPKRVAAAKLNKKLIDSLQSVDPYAKVITMGDLNDNPNNASVKKVLKAKDDRSKVPLKGIYNPFIKQFIKEGLGTTGYRDSWSLFDQIMISKSFLEKEYSSLTYYRAAIFNKPYLTNQKGKWKGYPYRSFANGIFTNGFSDHYPVYIYLIKELKKETITKNKD